jgi:hypothetical protein
MDKNNKDKWIDDTIQSIDGIKQAEASPFLYAKVLNRIKSGGKLSGYIPVKKAALGFLTILILAALNLAVILNLNSTSSSTDSSSNNINDFIPSQTNPYLEILSK